MGIYIHCHQFRLVIIVAVTLVINCRLAVCQSALDSIAFPSGTAMIQSLQGNKPILLAIGEFHDQKNADHKIQLLRTLHKNYGIRHILLEYAVCEEQLMNRFINGEDSAYSVISKTYQFREDRDQLMTAIRQFNQMHPNEKIVVHCVDTGDGKFSSYADALRLTFEGRDDIKNELPLMYRKLIRHNYSFLKTRKGGRRLTRKLIKDLEHQQEVYRRVLNEDFAFYERSLRAIVIGGIPTRKAWRHLISFEEREAFMASNISELLKSDSTGKLVGFFGNWHVNKLAGNDSLYNESGHRTVVSMLSRDTSIHAYSIFTDYVDARNYIKENYGDYPSRAQENSRLLNAMLGSHEYMLVDAKHNGLSDDVYLYCDLLLIKHSNIYPEGMAAHEVEFQIRLKEKRKAERRKKKG